MKRQQRLWFEYSLFLSICHGTELANAIGRTLPSAPEWAQSRDTLLTIMLNKKGFIDTMIMHNEKNSPLATLEPKVALGADPEAVALRADPACRETDSTAEKPQILEELIIEEVSIDGMCGVY